ncbi:MAG: metal ABC transporter permease [Planctomycetes bacterium]|nr:metal ABC transporter permease [Planctomycetota bacterium]
MLGYFNPASWQFGILLGVVCVSLSSGVLSPLVVSNRMSFFSEAVAHSTLAGVALGLIMGFDPLLTMIGVGVIVALLIAALRQRSPLALDTLLGVAMAGALAVGVILFQWKVRNYADMDAYLFGRITFLTRDDVIILALVGAAAIAVLAMMWNRLALLSVSRPLAQSRGLNVGRYDLLLIVLLAVVVCVTVRVVGLLLVNALLVIPAAASKNLARSYRSMVWGSLAVAVVSGLAGLFVGDYLKLPVGPAIVVAAVILFAASQIIGLRRGRVMAEN